MYTTRVRERESERVCVTRRKVADLFRSACDRCTFSSVRLATTHNTPFRGTFLNVHTHTHITRSHADRISRRYRPQPGKCFRSPRVPSPEWAAGTRHG